MLLAPPSDILGCRYFYDTNCGKHFQCVLNFIRSYCEILPESQNILLKRFSSISAFRATCARSKNMPGQKEKRERKKTERTQD